MTLAREDVGLLLTSSWPLPKWGVQPAGSLLLKEPSSPSPTPDKARGRTQINSTFNYIHLTRLSSEVKKRSLPPK